MATLKNIIKPFSKSFFIFLFEQYNDQSNPQKKLLGYVESMYFSLKHSTTFRIHTYLNWMQKLIFIFSYQLVLIQGQTFVCNGSEYGMERRHWTERINGLFLIVCDFKHF